MKTDKPDACTIITTQGKVQYSRYKLRPTNKEERQLLEDMTGIRSVVPLDDYLGITQLPFRMSIRAMLEVAFWAQNQCSYQRAKDILAKNGMIVNDETIRLVTNYVGNYVFKNDCKKAEEIYIDYSKCKLDFPLNLDGVLYIQTDGAALNTRTKNAEGSTWRENKLGEVFSSNNIRFWTDKHGNRQHRILKREYISFLGKVDDFKWHLLSCAVRGGYGKFKKTVLLSDGATWIRNMTEEIFPDAQQILDFYHLCENVNTFAKILFGNDESRYKPWAKDVCDTLKKSGYQKVLNDIKSTKDVKLDNCSVNLYAYISNNINNIDYATYIENGYFIGSGAIESGNKLILQQRLKQAGMRWNVDTAQPILTLKTKQESGLWEIDVVTPFIDHCYSLIKKVTYK